MKTKLYFFIKNIILYIIIFILGISFSTFANTPQISTNTLRNTVNIGEPYYWPNTQTIWEKGDEDDGSADSEYNDSIWVQSGSQWWYWLDASSQWVNNGTIFIDGEEYVFTNYVARKNSSNNNLDINNPTTNLNTPTTNNILQNGSEECIIPFSKITSIGGNEKQYDFYGVLLKGDINSYSGNRNFLKKSDLVNHFSELLNKCHYDGDFWKDFIDFLRQKLGIQEGTYFVKPNMEMRSQEISAMTKRNQALLPVMLREKMDLIIAAIGLFLICYGTLIIICGVIDELGLVNKYMTAMVSGGLLTKNKNGDMALTGDPSSFRRMYIGTGLAIIFVGVICLAPSIRLWFYYKIIWLRDTLLRFMQMSTDKLDTIGGQSN